ncbi:MAG: STAS domain-containing protein [Solirubrobacteraceae bacterium]|jgi:anti-anti-sigma factor
MPDALVLPDSVAEGAEPLSSAFACSWTDGGPKAAWVQVTGKLDRATVPQLERTLSEPQLKAGLVVLDLRELRFIDTAGVLAIVHASFCAREAGRRLILLRAPPNVDRMFTLTATRDDVEIGDVDHVEPAVQMHLEQDLAS